MTFSTQIHASNYFYELIPRIGREFDLQIIPFNTVIAGDPTKGINWMFTADAFGCHIFRCEKGSYEKVKILPQGGLDHDLDAEAVENRIRRAIQQLR